MAMIDWPDDVGMQPDVNGLLCVICRENKSPEDMTAGLCDATGDQAFACDSHFWSSRQFIIGWTDFIISQRLRELISIEEDSYDWPVR